MLILVVFKLIFTVFSCWTFNLSVHDLLVRIDFVNTKFEELTCPIHHVLVVAVACFLFRCIQAKSFCLLC